jgi:hypothetical protein
VIASGGMTTRGTDVIGLVASIADRDIAIGGVLNPIRKWISAKLRQLSES